MAIYRLEAKIISRGTNGRSVVAAAAYRAGEKLMSQLQNRTYDYTRRTKGIVAKVILTPEGSPEWTRDAGRLWNEVEQGEKRKDAQLSRELILAIPRELTREQQLELVTGWVQKEMVNQGMIAHICLHEPKDKKNPHAHVLLTMRKIEDGKFGKKCREWNHTDQLVGWRESWEHAANDALENAGRPERIDHRSLKDQGIDKIPEPKIGVKATAMVRRGIVADTERHKRVRWVKTLNATLPRLRLRALLDYAGAPPAADKVRDWWHRSVAYLEHARDAAQEAGKDIWQKLLESRHAQGHSPTPTMRRGPEMER